MSDDFTIEGRTAKVLELLETAHGHSLCGSIVPLRAAEADLDPSVEVRHEARKLVAEQLAELNGLKPTPERYRKALIDAIEKLLGCR